MHGADSRTDRSRVRVNRLLLVLPSRAACRATLMALALALVLGPDGRFGLWDFVRMEYHLKPDGLSLRKSHLVSNCVTPHPPDARHDCQIAARSIVV